VGERIAPPWLDAAAPRAVTAALGAGGWRAYYVGGCVRDALLGRKASDIDVATDAPPEAVIAAARSAGIRAVPTGIEHGTVTLVHAGAPVEVTTFRRDVETDGRRAVVAFTDDMAEDARRRDFTMNALYATPLGEVVDPLGGLPDLRARRLRFVGEPAERIAEDALRILRFFRFHAWYGDPQAGLDAEALAACAEAAEAVDGLSRERVGAEMAKLLAAPDPAPSVAAMASCGVLGRVLPGAEATALGPVVHGEGLAGLGPDWRRRLAALGGQADWPERLRLSRGDARAFEAIRAALDADEPLAASAYRHGREAAQGAALIRAAALGWPPPGDLAAETARGAAARFPLRAADLALEGPALGAALKRLEAAWVASDFTLDREALVALA
jgi:poly(A) polymerase